MADNCDITFFSGKTNASCKVHDAAWKSGVSLRVTQPARSEPDKVVLDWNSAIKNSRCVDLYNVYGKLKTSEDCRVALFLQFFMLVKSTLLYTYLWSAHQILSRILLQSNLALRNFLVTLKLFLSAKNSLLQTLKQSTLKGILYDESRKNGTGSPKHVPF